MNEQARASSRSSQQGKEKSSDGTGAGSSKEAHGVCKAKEMALSQERLKELLRYDSKSGFFTWIKRKGKVAGYFKGNNYVQIRIAGFLYQAHRLAWLYVHGYFPPEDVDHRNHFKFDNALENLRIGSRPQNGGNQIRAHRRNKCGLLGVCWHKQKQMWRAYIVVNRRQKHLGLFQSPEAAHAAYVEAKRKLHDFNML